MPKTCWIVAAAWLLLCGPGYDLRAAAGPRFKVDTWTEADGLPQDSVIAVTQTRDGYLWLGTGNGLARFDGNHFKVYEEKDIPGLNGSKIVKLFEDSQSRLWIGTETSGILLVDKDGKVTNPVPGKSTEGPLVSVCEDPNGGVWLNLAQGQLYLYWQGSVRLVAANCNRVIADESGIIWVGTPDGRLAGLGPIPKSMVPAIPVSYDFPVGRLQFLLASKRGGYWRLADGRIQKCRGDQVEKDFGPYPWANGVPVLTACEDREGNLVAGTFGDGVYWFDAAGKGNHVGGLPHPSIWSLAVDSEGNLWVGSNGGGLSRVKRQVFDTLDGTLDLTVQSVCEDHRGGLWIGYNGDRVDHWSEGLLQRFTNIWPTSMPASGSPGTYFYVRAVFEDSDEHVWAGSVIAGINPPWRLFRLDDGRFRPVVDGPSTITQDISVLYQDRRGVFWLGTRDGLACWDKQQWTVFGPTNDPSLENVQALADDAEGNLWVGTERGGLKRLRDGVFTTFRKQEKGGLPSDNVSSLYMDKEEVLWVGTAGGLARFYRGEWRRFTTQEGLISNKIGYLLEDGLGCLWIGSNAGLMRVAKKDLNRLAPGTAIPCRAFGKADGLPTGQCSTGSQPGACRARDGRLWFPTIKGLVSVNPALLTINTNPPPVLIEAVRIDGQLQNPDTLRASPTQSVTVPANKESLDIDYACLNLSAPDKVRFRHQLEGHETAWTAGGPDERTAHYAKLASGTYRFHVQACNEDGIWNEAGCLLAVKVLPPFWRQPWFVILTTLTLLGLIVGSVHYASTQRLQRQLAVLRQHEALEKERARIARDLHDQLGANLTQVALLGELAESDKDLPGEVEGYARQISQTARETTRALDEIVWTVNPSNDTLDGLINYVCKYAQEYLEMAGLRYRLEAPSQLPSTPISPELRHNVFLAAKEAVNNVVKHAHASSAWLRLRLEPDHFVLEVEDDGRGLPAAGEKKGRNGLRNMRKRMEDVGGTFEAVPRPEGGTRIRLTAPLTFI
jgi:ligand-binding sensor domain-containing protein/signal transduction histidine kinase